MYLTSDKKIVVYIFSQFTNRYDFYEKAVTFKPYQVRLFASILSSVYNFKHKVDNL